MAPNLAKLWMASWLHMSKPRSCILMSYRSRRWPSGRIGAAEQIDQRAETSLSLSASSHRTPPSVRPALALALCRLCRVAPRVRANCQVYARARNVNVRPAGARAAVSDPRARARCLCRRRRRRRRRPRAQAIHVRMLGAAAGTYTAAPASYVRALVACCRHMHRR